MHERYPQHTCDHHCSTPLYSECSVTSQASRETPTIDPTVQSLYEAAISSPTYERDQAEADAEYRQTRASRSRTILGQRYLLTARQDAAASNPLVAPLVAAVLDQDVENVYNQVGLLREQYATDRDVLTPVFQRTTAGRKMLHILETTSNETISATANSLRDYLRGIIDVELPE